MNESPPRPQTGTRVTHSTAATARAASKAFPPSCMTRSPAAAARGEFEQTMPFWPYTALRVSWVMDMVAASWVAG